jgi:hypothetical protein
MVVPVDPAPFLSTVILASAALVAIVGGLLVARFVGLDSDQQSSRKLLNDASDRLSIARRRAEAARQDLIRWDARDFLGEHDVVDAIADGQTDIGELRKLARTRLTDDELRMVIHQAAADIAVLRGWLSSEEVCERLRDAEYRWRGVSRDDMPALNYPQLAARVLDRFAAELAHDDAEKRRQEEARREDQRRRARKERQGAAESQLLGLGGAFRVNDSLLGLAGQTANMFKPPDYSYLTLRGSRTRPCGLDLGFYATRSYSLMRPPRTDRRLIRSWERSAGRWSGRGGRNWRLRWGRRPL